MPMQTSRMSEQTWALDIRSQPNRPAFISDVTCCCAANDAVPKPLAIECRGRKWATIWFVRPLDVFQRFSRLVEWPAGSEQGVGTDRLGMAPLAPEVHESHRSVSRHDGVYSATIGMSDRSS